MKELKCFLFDMGMILGGFVFWPVALIYQLLLSASNPNRGMAGVKVILSGLWLLPLALFLRLLTAFLPAVDPEEAAKRAKGSLTARKQCLKARRNDD